MNTDSLILRQTTFPPLTNKNDYISSAEFDSNLTKVYQDFVAICVALGVEAYNGAKTYDDTVIQFATYNGRLYQYINVTPGTGHSPADVDADDYWIEVFPTMLAHRRNSDTKLDEGGTNEVSASELKANLNGGFAGSKTFKAQISQTGTNAPVFTTVKNDFGGTITSARLIAGGYTLLGFDSQLTGVVEVSFSFGNMSVGTVREVLGIVGTSSVVAISTYIAGVQSDSVLNGFITVTKYP